jgi:hypothetical protein
MSPRNRQRLASPFSAAQRPGREFNAKAFEKRRIGMKTGHIQGRSLYSRDMRRDLPRLCAAPGRSNGPGSKRAGPAAVDGEFPAGWKDRTFSRGVDQQRRPLHIGC